VVVRFLLDSVILIDHFNGINAATQYLREYQNHCVLSVITRAEILTGFAPQQAIVAIQLLNQFPTLEMTVQIADLAAQLRRQERWRLPDAIQAAFAQLYQLQLVTRNTKDFPVKKYDFVVVPYVF
ncbi:MAG: PIN domain-containing protein, partial [Thermosynechococcaceae cyanobacterium]